MATLLDRLEACCKDLDDSEHEGFGVTRDWAEGYDCGMASAAEMVRMAIESHFGEQCASCGRRRDDHKVRHQFKEPG
jgi:hypothetical protein